MLSGGSKRWIGHGRKCNFQIRLTREVAILGFVECSFQVIDFGPDMNSAGQSAAVGSVIKRGELGQGSKRQVYLRNCARHAIVLELHHEIWREMNRIHQLEQGSLGVSVGNDRLAADLFASGKYDAGG